MLSPGLRIDRRDDPVDVVTVDQEVLAEALARDVATGATSRSSRG
jgi:hypothetical protein